MGRLTRTFAAPQSYWRASKAPRYSLLFALPLLALYEAMAALSSYGPGGGIRNGADVLLRDLFLTVAGRQGPLLFILTLLGIGVWLIGRDMRSHGMTLRPSVFLRMLAESVSLALAFGFVVGGITARLLGMWAAMAAPGPTAVALQATQTLDFHTRLMVSLGAGLYEELFFRVLLVSALAAGARALLGPRPLVVGTLASVLGAALFSTFHYLGPYGDRLELQSFVFRFIAGLAFSALYLLRGFGITAWTHALYDVFLLIA